MSANPTLRDLMQSAIAKSRKMSSPESTTSFLDVLRQNRFVTVINSALARNPLNSLVSDLDATFMQALPQNTSASELPSCPSEEWSSELPDTKIPHMELTDEPQLSELEEIAEEEEDDAVFERLMNAYDADERLYQKYNKYGYTERNIDTNLGRPIDSLEELIEKSNW